MLRFLRNALKNRRVQKIEAQHHTSSDFKKASFELDKVSSALKAAEAELSKVSSNTLNRDDAYFSISSALKQSDEVLVELSSSVRKSDDQLARQVIQQGALAELGQHALSGTDLDGLMRESCFLISQTLDVEFCDLIEVSEDLKMSSLRAAYGWPLEEIPAFTSDDEAAAKLVIGTKEPLVYQSLKEEKRFKPAKYLLDQSIDSGVNVLVLGHERPFGVLGAHTKKSRKFNQDEVIFVQTIANMLGTAIQRKESESLSSQLASIVQYSDDAIISVSLDGIILSWNPSAEKMFGFSAEEIMGGKIGIIVPDDKKNEHRMNMELLRRGGAVGNLETVRLRKDGTPINVSITISPIRNKAGDVIGISKIARDITKEKTAADQLLRSEMQLKSAQRIAQIGSWELDMTTNSLNWSEEMYRIFGFSSSETLDPNLILERVHPEDLDMLKQLRKKLAPFIVEYRILRPDGEVRYIQSRGEVMYNAEGQPEKMLGTSQDITDRRRADEQLRSSREQMRALSAHLQFIREEERTRIAREVHDELGQVLTALKMDLALLNQKLLESSAILPRRTLYDEIKSMTKKVDSTIASVRKIVTELRPEVLDHLGLKSAIEWQAQEFQSRSGIECTLSPTMDFVEVIDRDSETAIFRILQEALTNVARHSGATHVDIFLTRRNGDLIMEVKDNGRGVTNEDLSKSRSFGLLGMRERALFLGGDVEVSGSAGEGTSVKVRVPLRMDSR
jgi:PAS domain S-box-containing protein